MSSQDRHERLGPMKLMKILALSTIIFVGMSVASLLIRMAVTGAGDFDFEQKMGPTKVHTTIHIHLDRPSEGPTSAPHS